VLELVIAIYIGYFGAGVGILLLALLALFGLENIHERVEDNPCGRVQRSRA
jgi:hypothetical protein